MAIRLHSFISSGKRYIQVESQPHHITGIFRTIMHSSHNLHFWKFKDAKSAYFECVEDGTITFYQAATPDADNYGIWTYLVYEYLEGEEKVFCDLSIDTSIDPLQKLLSGQKLIHKAVDINEYLYYQYNQAEYLDVKLPVEWNTPEGRKIANVISEEFRGFKASPVFAEGAGKEYMKSVLDGFIQAAHQVLAGGGTVRDFDLIQLDILDKTKIDEIANSILEYNDYRIWQAALPSKSKAVEYAFNSALNLLCQIK